MATTSYDSFMHCVWGICLCVGCATTITSAEKPSPESITWQALSVPIKDLRTYTMSDYYQMPPKGGAGAAYQIGEAAGSIILFDVNGDGKITEGVDLVAHQQITRLVPAPSQITLPSGIYEITRIDRTKKAVVTRKIPSDIYNQNIYDGIFLLNTIRNRNGMAPVMLSEEPSRACDQHAQYVSINKTQGMALHKEKEGNPKYTKEGADAAAGSSIYPGKSDLTRAIEGWLRSSWHSWPLIDPSTKICGVTNSLNLCMFYRDTTRTYPTKNREFSFPSSQTTDVPTAFNDGEIPVPVPGRDTATLGLPVIWRSPDSKEKGISMILERMDGKIFEAIDGDASSPDKPANPKGWPSNSGLRIFVPFAPLRTQSTYRITISQNGKHIRQYQFTTGDASDYLDNK